MKRTLSLILSALLLASSMASCGKTEPETEKTETKAGETEVFETVVSETTAAETDASASSYATDRITENGVSVSHIVLLDGASQLEKYASEELVTHIKLVSGADVAVTNEIQADSMPIIIATPDSLPALEELFPEDLAWLRDLGNPKEDVRFAEDGFAVRQLDGKIYIFGAVPKGALNGVYDFIEDNLGVLWIRAENMSEYPTIYDEMPTVELAKINYREKSPFAVRGWSLGNHSNETSKMWTRNKMTSLDGGSEYLRSIGLQDFLTGHSIKNWITTSPSYDPSCTEYWGTDAEGNHYTHEESMADYEGIQVNFWSDVTMQCIADSVLAYLDAYYESTKVRYIGISLQDSSNIMVYPEKTEPYEYEPGKFIDPGESNYISTVYFSFINKIARIVAEKYPDVNIHAYSYLSTLQAPECDLDYNVYATFCPIEEDLSAAIDNPDKMSYQTYLCLVDWCELTSNVMVYNYYADFVTSPFYCRPIWYRIQSDLQLYAENGFNGTVPEGYSDTDGALMPGYATNEHREPYQTVRNNWTMNALTYWLYCKLAWNPYEDVDALIQYFCDKVYGDASEYMLEYYRILTLGWNEGGEMMLSEFNVNYYLWTGIETVWDYFLDIEVDGVHIISAIKETLHKAYDAADERGREHIRYMMENYDRLESLVWDK